MRALETDDDTLATAVEVGNRMGKEVVVIKESPGFITSRINAMIGNEAFHMLQEGIASASDIDKALKLGLNHPMGPFELVDLVGLDTRLNILEYLHKSLGDKYRPAPLLVQYVKAGRVGNKSGRGVYEYPEPSADFKITPAPFLVRSWHEKWGFSRPMWGQPPSAVQPRGGEGSALRP